MVKIPFLSIMQQARAYIFAFPTQYLQLSAHFTFQWVTDVFDLEANGGG